MIALTLGVALSRWINSRFERLGKPAARNATFTEDDL